jgi:hypothetical protein
VDILQCKKSKENKDYLDILKNIEEKYINGKSVIFYPKIDNIIRDFLKHKNSIDITKMTFDEIKYLKLDEKIENLIKNIYFREFNQNLDDNLDLRKEILEKIKDIISENPSAFSHSL